MRSLVLSVVILCLVSVAPAYGDNGREHILNESSLAPISEIVQTAIREGKTPGSVVLIGDSEGIIYRRAFGYRSIEPERVPMTEDTIFDVASLTKVIATSTAVMQLVEKGKIGLDVPASRYWPEFKKNGKSLITIRHLLTHYSGLRADLSLAPRWSGYRAAIKKIVKEKPLYPPGSCYIYSDINFEILGEIVRRVSGLPLDKYCSRNIFRPLGMKDTSFRPSADARPRIAPTEYRDGKMLCGAVHDPSCYFMGGVSGHAGLFSTADDLALFAGMMLHGGSSHGVKILKTATVERMTIPQSPPGGHNLRGLGWDIEPPFAPNSIDLHPVGSYGHLGYTGTAIWIDPVTKTYIIVLTNRLHPKGTGDVRALRAAIKKVVADALGPLSDERIIAARPSLSAFFRQRKIAAASNSASDVSDPCKLQTGIDVLAGRKFSDLKGLRVGLITNHTGLDSKGERTIDLLLNAPGVRLKAIFSPEHGLGGQADSNVPSSRDHLTSLPVYSLYGSVRKPSDKMLDGLDAIVFDIQDAGVRFYTYISTMGYAMEAAAKKGIPFYVLDRPNPITASFVQGPMPGCSSRSFTSYFPLPVRHGMTAGELATMFNREYKMGARLHVIRMQGYGRTRWFDETGLAWVNPSPNLRSLTEATLYPGVAMAEGANVSVGRGTETPFEVVGAPWIDASKLASYLNDRKIPGIRFEPADFVPVSSNYTNQPCHGARIILTDRLALDAPYLGIEIISALYRLNPREFRLDDTAGLAGGSRIMDEIKNGADPRAIRQAWQKELDEFGKLRAKYLLY